MRILFRAEGDQGVGFGHLMRCLSLADTFRSRGVEVAFVTNARTGRELLEQRGYEVLSTSDAISAPDPSLEAESMESSVRRCPAQALIVDSYLVSEDLFRSYFELFPLVGTIDDLKAEIYPASFLIHVSIGHTYPEYAEVDRCHWVLAGLPYCLLRQEFEDVTPRVVRDRVSDVLVTTGSMDIDDVPVRLAGALVEALPGVRVHVVEGNLFTNTKGLQELAAVHSNVVIHRRVQSMRALMEQADVAVSAGGVTVYELMRCGTPVVALALADNQVRIMDKLAESEQLVLARNCGDAVGAVEALSANFKQREFLSRRGQEVIDGQGARRVVDAILALASSMPD